MAEYNFFPWERFLCAISPLFEEKQHKIRSERLNFMSNEDIGNCLAARVSEQLRVDHAVMSMRNIILDASAGGAEGKRKQQQLDVSPLDASASKWTVRYLIKYIKRDQVDLVEALCKSLSLGRISFPAFKENLINCSHQIGLMDKHSELSRNSGDELKLWMLPHCEMNEATISILVQNVIGPVCQSLEVIMKPQIKFQNNEQFGTAIVDFALEYKGFCVGVVEVKIPKTLGPDSVSQLLQPLMKLQVKNKDSRVAYLGILTDGFRYVFVKLQGKKFIFENAKSDADPGIKIHTLTTWADVETLLKHMRSILDDNLIGNII